MTSDRTVMRSASSIMLVACFAPIEWAQTRLASIAIKGAPITIEVLVESPSETDVDLQAICLFSSTPANTVHATLLDTNEELKNVLDHIRTPELFRGFLGETFALIPPRGTIAARELLLIGLGESQTFSPDRMQIVGEALYTESSRLGVPHPYFAPTILDGGVNNFTTSQISEQVMIGFFREAAIARALKDAKGPAGKEITGLTFLAGAKSVESTRQGIEKAIATVFPRATQ